MYITLWVLTQSILNLILFIMKKVYTAQDRLIVNHLKNILELHNIPCVIKNEYLAGAAGELPLTECWPELWITEDQHAEQARELVATLDHQNQPRWTCSRCGESLEGQFTACWRCGESRYR